MADIKVLEQEVWSKIAAGEVVEKPASVVKELVENSIDAKATEITVEIKDGGTKLICVTDNGSGIKAEQIETAFLAHATSKLSCIDDLYNLSSMGFRGEALASISAVSQVELITKTENEEIGHKICVEGGKKTNLCEIASIKGTQIKVNNLFFNTPARAKFLRKLKTEENDITSYIEKLMLSHPEINFKYIIDDKLIYNTFNCDLIDIIYTIYGKDISSNMIKVDYHKNDYKVSGYISNPVVCKSNKTYQSLFVNKRYCINQTISASISNAYENYLMKGKYPVYVLFLDMPSGSVDVNVHPNKLEVKFDNSQNIYMLFNNAVYDALSRQSHIQDALPEFNEHNEKTEIKFNTIKENEGVSFTAQVKNEEISLEDEKTLFNTNEIYKKPELKFNQELFNNISLNSENNETELFTQDEIKTVSVEPEKKIYDDLFIKSFTVIGAVFDTYIVVQQEENLYFIDQHAAHERLLFDKFIAQVNNNEIVKQDLLLPYVFEVNNQEAEFIDNNMEILESQGFALTLFGKNCYKVTTIPMMLNGINLKEYFSSVLSGLVDIVKKPQEIIRRHFATMACKAAVKGGNELSDNEINTLLSLMKDNHNTLLCPHGRPIIVTFDKKQIEKMFKRIV